MFVRQSSPLRRFAKIAGWRRRFPGIEWTAMFDVVGIGLNAIDFLWCVPRSPMPGEKLRMSGFSRRGGGQVATALVALSRWGLRTMYVGNVGDDEHGRLSLSLLREEGVDVSRARTVPGAASQFAVILVQEDSGERTILWERDARIRIRPGEIPGEEIRRARAAPGDGPEVAASPVSARAARRAGGDRGPRGRREGGGGRLSRGVPVRPSRGQTVSRDSFLQQCRRRPFLQESGRQRGHPPPRGERSNPF